VEDTGMMIANSESAARNAPMVGFDIDGKALSVINAPQSAGTATIEISNSSLFSMCMPPLPFSGFCSIGSKPIDTALRTPFLSSP
jgi:hypothetical protein